MEMVMKNEIILGNYLGLLNSLSKESKMKLIESLNFEINNGVKIESNWIDKLYGSFITDKSVEELISEIRKDRCFNRETAGF